MQAGGREVDVDALVDLVGLHLRAGVHGLWVLGTTARFDLLSDEAQRVVAETVARVAGGRVPLVLNVSADGTERTLERSRRFEDLPYDYHAALAPWYLKLRPEEVDDHFRALADEMARPLVIYNAPWVANELTWPSLRRLAEHPRIAGCKDVTVELGRPLDWTAEERGALGFAYLHGSDLVADSTALGADGFVSALSDVVPELAVATWEAARAGDAGRAARLQAQLSRVGRIQGFGPQLACLDVAGRHRGLYASMLPRPLRGVDAATASRVVEVCESVGFLPPSEVEVRVPGAARTH
jgi:4-hydroxy-tetrahydrodipicolinate synthase